MPRNPTASTTEAATRNNSRESTREQDNRLRSILRCRDAVLVWNMAAEVYRVPAGDAAQRWKLTRRVRDETTTPAATTTIETSNSQWVSSTSPLTPPGTASTPVSRQRQYGTLSGGTPERQTDGGDPARFSVCTLSVYNKISAGSTAVGATRGGGGGGGGGRGVSGKKRS